MTRSNSTGIAILLSTLLVSNISFAASCYEKSPNLISLGDQYFDLENTKSLTHSDKNALNSALKKMVGNWKGKGSTFQCIGPELDPTAENKPFTLSAKITTNASNELHIETEKHLTDEKIRFYEHLFFFGDVNSYQSVSITANKIVFEEKFRPETGKPKPETERETAESESETPDSEVDKAVEDGITFLFEMMHSMVPGRKAAPPEPAPEPNIAKRADERFTPLYEMLHTIEYTNTRFTYTLRRYINGHLAIEERWKLTRN